jgi:tetratricopeptide (TPR) repeat protein
MRSSTPNPAEKDDTELRHDNHVAYHYEAGLAALSVEDFDAVFEHLGAALEDDPGFFAAYLPLAYAYYLSGDDGTAEETVRDALPYVAADDPGRHTYLARLNFARGIAVAHQGRHHEAGFIFREAQTLAELAGQAPPVTESLPPVAIPEGAQLIAQCLLQQAISLDRLGRLVEARALLDEAAIFADDPAEINAALARLHEREGDFESAARRWQLAGRPEQATAEMHRRAAIFYHQTADDDHGDLEEYEVYEQDQPVEPPTSYSAVEYALAHSLLAIGYGSQSYAPYAVLATILGARDLPYVAAATYDQAVELAPGSFGAHVGARADVAALLVTAAGAHVALGDYAAAAQYSGRAHELAPDDPQIAACYASTLVASRRAGEAVAALRLTLALRPLDADLMCHLASALVAAGQRDEATAVASTAEEHAESASVQEWLATVWAQLGQWERSVRLLFRAARLQAGTQPGPAHTNHKGVRVPAREILSDALFEHAVNKARAFSDRPGSTNARADFYAAVITICTAVDFKVSPPLITSLIRRPGDDDSDAFDRRVSSAVARLGRQLGLDIDPQLN